MYCIMDRNRGDPGALGPTWLSVRSRPSNSKASKLSLMAGRGRLGDIEEVGKERVVEGRNNEEEEEEEGGEGGRRRREEEEGGGG